MNCWRCNKPLPGVEPPAEPICDLCYESVVALKDERALADDAAVLLDRLNLHDEDWHEAVTQWQARWQEARGR
jgi:glutathione S-transferase